MSVVVVAAAAVAVLVARAPTARRRLGPRRTASHVRQRTPMMLVGAAAIAALMLVAGPVVTAVVVGAAAALTARRAWRESSFVSGDTAVVADLLAACISAGATVPAALAVSADVAAQPVAALLRAVSRRLLAGDDAELAWADVLRASPSYADVARACSRGALTGAAVADELRRCAARQRVSVRADQRRRLHRNAVWMVVPVGLCFLPAFVLVGVVPVVVSVVPAVLR